MTICSQKIWTSSFNAKINQILQHIRPAPGSWHRSCLPQAELMPQQPGAVGSPIACLHSRGCRGSQSDVLVGVRPLGAAEHHGASHKGQMSSAELTLPTETACAEFLMLLQGASPPRGHWCDCRYVCGMQHKGLQMGQSVQVCAPPGSRGLGWGAQGRRDMMV